MPVQYPRRRASAEHLHCRAARRHCSTSPTWARRMLPARRRRRRVGGAGPRRYHRPEARPAALHAADRRAGGIIDDLMVANLGDDGLFVVVNGAARHVDFTASSPRACRRGCSSTAGGPRAARPAGPAAPPRCWRALAPEAAALAFMGIAPIALAGVDLLRLALRLHRRGRLRDLRAGRRRRASGARSAGAARGEAGRPRRPRLAAPGGRAAACTATTSTRRPARSRPG